MYVLYIGKVYCRYNLCHKIIFLYDGQKHIFFIVASRKDTFSIVVSFVLNYCHCFGKPLSNSMLQKSKKRLFLENLFEELQMKFTICWF